MAVPLTRRRFLVGAGAGLVAAPFASLLAGRRAQAATTGPKRLVVFFSPNGTIHRHWRPQGSETSFTFAAGSILEPLASRKDRLVVLDGLDFVGADNHEPGMGAMLTNGDGAGSVTGGASVDQVVARHIGNATKFRSIELGIQTSSWGGSTQTRMSYARSGVFVTPDDSPRNAFDRFFGDLAGGAAGLEKLRRRRKSVLDAVGTELDDLHGRLGTEERRKLEAHVQAIREVEKGIDAPPPAACQVPAQPDRGPLYDNDLFPTHARQQIDLAVRALACGLTNVASIQLSHTVGDRVYGWLGLTQGHHSLSHSDDGSTAGVNDFVKAERWNAERFAYLLDALAAAPDPAGGMLLDSTLVLWAKELGDGRLHTCKSVPWVLAGGGGALRTGRYLQLGGKSHAHVLVSICRAFGLTRDTFGNPETGRGPLEALS